MLKRILLFLTFLFWPLSLFFANTPRDFINHVLPTMFLVLFYFLSKSNTFLKIIPLVAIPFVEPKLLLLSVTLFLLYAFKAENKNATYRISIAVSTVILFIVCGKSFFGQTVFHFDYEAQQSIIRNTNLYTNPLIARLFHNKAKIYTDKISSNSGALLDPTNYFFAFQPREIKIDNQNLQKFPFTFLIFFLVGVYHFAEKKKGRLLSNRFFIAALLFSGVLNLSILTVFDRTDFILWYSMCLVITFGITKMHTYKYARFIEILCILFSLFELLKILVK